MTQRDDAVLLLHLAAAIDGLADTVQLFAEVNTVDAIDPNVQSGLTHVHHLVSVARSHIESARPPAPEGGEDPRPEKCRFRLQEERKPYPRSSCEACGATVLTGLGVRCQYDRPSTTPQPDPRDKLMPRIKECIEQLRDRLNEIDRWQNGERNSLPAFSQAVIFADKLLIDLREALGDG